MSDDHIRKTPGEIGYKQIRQAALFADPVVFHKDSLMADITILVNVSGLHLVGSWKDHCDQQGMEDPPSQS